MQVFHNNFLLFLKVPDYSFYCERRCPDVACIVIQSVCPRCVRETCPGRGDATVDVRGRLKDWVRIFQP